MKTHMRHDLVPLGSALLAAVLWLALPGCGGDDETPGGMAGAGLTTTGGTGGAGAQAGSGVGGEPTGGSAGSSAGGAGGAGAGEPSRYPLELVLPREAGTAPSADAGTPTVPAGHRIFRAYPGIEYEVRAAVLGGSYPFRFSLSNEPDGMLVDAVTGVVRWPSPAGANASPTITVTDAEGASQSAAWTIEVTTDGFVFLDAVAGSDTGAGTLASPWQSLDKLKSSGAAGQIAYFRDGTYTTAGMATSGGDTWVRVEFNGTVHPVQWLAYPGESPVLSNGYEAGVSNGQFVRLSGSDDYPVYVDGLTITDAWDKGLQFGSGSCDYPVFRNLSVHGIAEAIDGANSAGIMTLSSYADPSWYGVYQNLDFFDNAPGGIKQYSHKKLLWEDCTFRDSGGGPDLKAHVPRFEVRACSFVDNTGNYCGLFGNMNFGAGGDGEAATGEVRFNRMLCGDAPDRYAMDVNQDGMAGAIDLYRNTFVGTVRVRNTDTADGPFWFDRNVIVNSNAGSDHITLEEVSDPTRITTTENLTGTPAEGIVDSEGSLQGTYEAYVGTRGYELP